MKRVCVEDLYRINSNWLPETDVRIIVARNHVVYEGEARGMLNTYGKCYVKYFYGDDIILDDD